MAAGLGLALAGSALSMATLLLGTVGRALGGPLGGLAGTLIGGGVDRAIFGSGAARDGPRLANLAVQSSAYGQALPRLYGRMRVAGNVIWSSGIRESVQHSGGGKRGPSTNAYSYTASFAVAVSARQVNGFGRIWADGKLLRDASGTYLFPATVRSYAGSEDQLPDPLIVAAEGIGLAPAYRGLAYLVFDSLPLADYANRIPNLTFEVIGDSGGSIDIGVIAADLCEAAGNVVIGSGSFTAVQGFVASRVGTVRAQLEPLVAIADLVFTQGDATLAIAAGPGSAVRLLDADALGAALTGKPVAARTDHRAAATTIVDSLALGFSDPSRDYQFGLQRAARRIPAINVTEHDLPVALDPIAAKRLAEKLLALAIARRSTAELQLPWRYADLHVGDVVQAGVGGSSWRVRKSTLVGMIVELEVEALPGAAAAGSRAADGGRPLIAAAVPAGPTVLHVLDLPSLPGALPATPRLWLAAAGASAGWQRADVLVSNDAGNSYGLVASAGPPATMGQTGSSLAASASDRWNRSDTLDVVLLNPSMWLESRSELAVLAGANLALIGDELVQFTTAVALSAGRFRLGGWLRGRRGSVVTGHVAAERFVMIDSSQLVPFDPPIEAIGSSLRCKAVGAMEDAASVVWSDIVIGGNALRPLAPVHLRATKTANGDVIVSWTRCSRSGFAWLDSVEVPIAEERETYRIDLWLDGRHVIGTDVTAASLTYPSTAFAADGGPAATVLMAQVSQASAVVGPGRVAAASFLLGGLSLN